MKTTMIYCTPTQQGVHSFYLITEYQKYYLFIQNYMYIRYIEKKNEIAVHEKKRNKSFERYHKKCA